MDLETFLNHRNLSLAQIAGAIGKELSLGEDDCLFAAGSLLEGLGTPTSDLDLFLLSDRTDFAFHSMTDLAFTINGCLIDVRVVRHAEAEALRERFAGRKAAPRNARAAFEFTEDERKYMHRVAIGRALLGDAILARHKSVFDPVSLARHKLDWARHLASTFLVDIVGFLAAEDAQSAYFASQKVLSLTFDILLAGHGVMNPNTKWRARFLRNLPADWEERLPGRPSALSAADAYRSFYNLPVEDTWAAARDHALNVAMLYRRIVPWAELELYGSGYPRRSAALTSPEAAGPALPQLAIDIDIFLADDRLWLARLRTDGEPIEIEREDVHLFTFFDGRTGLREAARSASPEPGSVDATARRLEKLCWLLRYHALEAGAASVDRSLRHILQTSS